MFNSCLFNIFLAHKLNIQELQNAKRSAKITTTITTKRTKTNQVVGKCWPEVAIKSRVQSRQRCNHTEVITKGYNNNKNNNKNRNTDNSHSMQSFWQLCYYKICAKGCWLVAAYGWQLLAVGCGWTAILWCCESGFRSNYVHLRHAPSKPVGACNVLSMESL